MSMSFARGTSKRRRSIAFIEGADGDSSDEIGETERSAKTMKLGTANDEDEDERGGEILFPPRNELYESHRSLNPANGIIESIELKNFMCHTFLELQFSPTVTFITGKNGSGKSAVMSAAMIALGSSAASTSRCQNLKSFVKKGEKMAQITVRLRNSGGDPFKSEVYGKSIVVERTIYADQKSGSYKLKSEAGKVVSQRKEELQNALDHFDIMIENPACLLTQDTSRSFLHSSSPRDKYTLFMKATHLEQIHSDHKLIQENNRIMKDTLERKKKDLPMLEQSFVALKNKVEELDELDQLMEKREKLRREMAWAIVMDYQKAVEKRRGAMSSLERREVKWIEKVEDQKLLVEEVECAHKAIDDEFDAMTRDLQKLHEEKGAEKEESKRKWEAFSKAEREVKRLKKELGSAIEDKAAVEAKMKEMETVSHLDWKAETQRREERILGLNQQIKECDNQQKSCRDNKRRIDEDFAEATMKLSDLNRSVDKDLEAIRHCESLIGRLERNKADSLQIYGSSTAAIVRDITRESRFARKPKGPIGRYLTVKESQWAPAVEKALGGLVYAFCCEARDYRILQEIIDRNCQSSGPNYRKPAIVTQKKFTETCYDVWPRLPRCDQKNFFDVVECADSVVFNVLVDQKSVDSLLFIEDVKTAKRIMHIEKPKGARTAFTPQLDQVVGGSTNRFYAGEMNRRPSPKVLQQSVEGKTEEEKGRLALLKQNLSEMRFEREGLDSRKKELNREKGSLVDKLHRLANELYQYRSELEELELVEDDNGPGDLAALKEALEESQLNISALTQESELKGKEKLDRRSESDTHAAKMQGITEQISAAANQMDDKRAELVAKNDELEKTERRLTHYQSKHAQSRELIQTEQTALESLEGELETSTEKAARICPLVETDKTPRELDRSLFQMDAIIQNRERCTGNREEIIKACSEAQLALRGIKRNVKSCERIQEKLDEMMKVRKRFIKGYRSSLSTRAQIAFRVTANQRGFKGKMIVDHVKRELDLTIYTSEENERGTSDMKSLSGGERSFATVCFVVSLWVIVNSPIHILDEFDIFMDMVNRDVSMKMLVKLAGKKADEQHIFLTPQSMSAVSGIPSVKKLAMPDPDRN